MRVLQEQQVERLGGKKVINLDVRIIATTNRDLASYVAEGNFREDLYYRLSVFPLNWLPLRERVEDIMPLVQRLLKKHATKMRKPVPQMEPDMIRKLLAHPWPGNVRELDNTIQRALILQQGQSLMLEDLMLTPMPKRRHEEVPVVATDTDEQPLSPIGLVSTSDQALGHDLKQREIELIVQALSEEKSRKEAANRLGISPRTLRYKVAKLREEGVDIEAQLSH